MIEEDQHICDLARITLHDVNFGRLILIMGSMATRHNP
jgi:hypothetical protein